MVGGDAMSVAHVQRILRQRRPDTGTGDSAVARLGRPGRTLRTTDGQGRGTAHTGAGGGGPALGIRRGRTR